ncbi:hypothetical protein P4S63_20245 [Pseudoalteromonas sp. B193]
MREISQFFAVHKAEGFIRRWCSPRNDRSARNRMYRRCLRFI